MLTRKSLMIILAILFCFAVPSGLVFSQNEETPPGNSTDAQTIQTPAADDTTTPDPSSSDTTSDDSQLQNQPEEDQGQTPTDENQPATKKTKKSLGKTQSMSQTAVAAGGGGDENNSFSVPPLPDTYVYTGSAGYKIPITVPPGRNGLAPKLSMTYNSYRGNSWLGVGWNLDLGSIRRSTKHGLNYSTYDFVYESNGSSEELVSQPAWGTNYYEAKIEEEFSKYYYNTGSNGWEVTAKDGTKYYYGSTGASRQENVSGIFKWCLDKIEDTNGNYLTLTYTKDQGEIYLDRIDYTGHNGLTPSNYVKFYLESRTDTVYNYDSNTKVVTAKRLKSIEIRANGNMVRAYKLEYTNSANTTCSLLQKVQQYGSDTTLDVSGNITGGSPLPAVTLTYSQGDNHYGSISNTNNLSWSGTLLTGDFNGDGKTDFARYYLNGQQLYIYCSLSKGDGTFYPVVTTNCGNSYNYAYSPVTGDFNGDGKTDIAMYYENGSTWYLITKLSNGDGTFRAGGSSTFTGTYGTLLSGDFNGDGKTDFAKYYLTGQQLWIYTTLSKGDGTFYPVVTTNGGSGYNYPYTPQTGDFDGDGRTDIAMYYDNGSTWFLFTELSNSDGTFRAGGSNYLSSTNGTLLSGDFNGDGKTDFAKYYLIGQQLWLYTTLSKGDGTFDTVVTTNGGSGYGFAYTPQTGDYNGDGKTDIFMTYDGPNWYIFCKLSKGDGTFQDAEANYLTPTSGTLMVGDYNGDGKSEFTKVSSSTISCTLMNNQPPDKLVTINNSYGGSASIGYNPSSQYQNTNLPFILQTVSSVTLNDGLGNSAVSAYTYSGGLYDYTEREFRGFAYAKKTNPDTTKEKTWFHQDKYLQGRPYQAEFRDPGATLLSKTTLTWETEALSSGVTFVKLSSKRSESYDDQTVFSQEDYTYDDTNGNLLTTLSQGTDAENITKTSLYQNYGTWVWRLTQETITGGTSGQGWENYYTYENNTGNLLSKSSWLNGGSNPVISMTYDDYGNVISVTDAWGNAGGNPQDHTTYTDYDTTSYTYPIKVTAPPTNGVTHITQTNWNYLFGRPSWTKDENTNITYYQYDLFGRIQQIDYPDNGQTLHQYYDNVFPRYVLTRVKEDAAGHFIDKYQYYDGFGRSIQTSTLGENNQPIISKTHYDNMGRVNLSEGPFFAAGMGYPQQPPTSGYPWTMITYDHRGRPVQIEQPHGDYPEPVGLYYSYSGFSTTMTDSDISQKTEKKDYLGRIKEVIEYNDPEEYHTTYQYNAAGDLLNITNALGHQTILSYDTLGRKTAMQDPDMGPWSYTYDPNGNLLTQTDAKGQVITFTYDALNRVLTKSTGTTYAYDNTTIPNGKGKIYSVSKDTTSNINNAYDALGRVTSTTKTISGSNYTTLNTYDLSGKVTQITYPDGHSVTNTYYPGTGLVQSVSSGTTIYGLFTDYEPTGKIGQVNHQNGTATKYTYDPWSTKLFGIVTVDPSGQPANDLQNKTYHYTRAGDIDQIVDQKKDVTYTYTYDRLHRLTGETSSGAGAPTATEVVILDYTYGYSAHVHAVSNITLNNTTAYSFNYDLNGNLTQGADLTNPNQVATRTVTYDQDNMPIQIVHPQATVNFTYDGLGTRVKKAVQGGSTTYYIGAHYEVKDGVITKYIFGGNLRLAVIKGTNTYYYHKDHLGSTGAITDNAGNKVEGTEYLPFGSMREHTGSNVSDYKFTDQELDNETNLYNYDARLYDPVLGMFVTPDSIVPNMFDPQELNRYSYCRNNPLIYTDPTGHDHNWEGCDWSPNSIDFTKNRDKRKITEYSRRVIEKVFFNRETGTIDKVFVTRIESTAEEQTDIMYNNLENKGVQNQRDLYGPDGDKVIDAYEKLKEEGADEKEIKAAMLEVVKKEKPSDHMKNDSTKQTIDVDIAKKITEEEKKSIKKAIIDDPDIRQKRTFLPPKDPVYHLTINQPATVYKGPRPIVN